MVTNVNFTLLQYISITARFVSQSARGKPTECRGLRFDGQIFGPK